MLYWIELIRHVMYCTLSIDHLQRIRGVFLVIPLCKYLAFNLRVSGPRM